MKLSTNSSLTSTAFQKTNGYILILKGLKYMFRQKSQISQTYIFKLTRGKSISNSVDKALLEYYHTMSDCCSS